MARWFMDRSAHRGIPSVSLRRLLPDAWFPGCEDLMVSGCSSDARRLEPGEVFVAIRTPEHDGHDDVERALERGASAVVVQIPSAEAGRLQVIVPDTRKALGRLAHALAGQPCENLRLSAICGSEGADAASVFLRSILEASGERVGLVSPTDWSDGQSRYPLRSAELAPPDLVSLLGRMIDRRCASALVCLSQKAVAKGSAESLTPLETLVLNVRALGVEADAQSDTRRAFSKVARSVTPLGTVIVNADDPDAELLGGVNLDARRVAFSMTGEADVSGVIEHLDGRGTRLRVRGFAQEFRAELKPVGRQAALAALAASAVAWSRGLDASTVVRGLEAVERIPGRLEAIGGREGVDARLENPRSAAELARALTSMREWVTGEIICVVPESAEESLVRTAEALSDRVEAASEPAALGISDPVLDRAIEQARPGDGVLIAGGPRWLLLTDRGPKRSIPAPMVAPTRRSA